MSYSTTGKACTISFLGHHTCVTTIIVHLGRHLLLLRLLGTTTKLGIVGIVTTTIVTTTRVVVATTLATTRAMTTKSTIRTTSIHTAVTITMPS